MIEFKGLDVAGLFLLLKENENAIDDRLKKLSDRIELYLYERLSIQEMEELKDLYSSRDGSLEKKI